jgi:CHAT domain-containing protein
MTILTTTSFSVFSWLRPASKTKLGCTFGSSPIHAMPQSRGAFCARSIPGRRPEMRLLVAAIFAIVLPLRAAFAASSPAQELAARFVEVLRRDDLGLLPRLTDQEETNPQAWPELSSLLDRYDCISVERYEWSLEPVPGEKLGIRVDLEGEAALKADWRPRERLPRSWHLEARRAGGSWRITRAATEELRVARAMVAATIPEAEQILDEASGEDRLKAIAHYGAEIERAHLDPAHGRERFEHALSLARETADAPTEINVMRSYAKSFVGRDLPQMLAVSLAAEERARAAGDRDALAEARLTLGFAQFANGDTDRARETYAAGTGMAGFLNDPTTAMKCLQMDIWLGISHDSAVEMLRGNERLLELAQRYGWEEGESVALFNRAIVHFNLGNFDVVRADYLRLIRLSQAHGNRRFAAAAKMNLASMEMRESHFEQASRHLTEAFEFFSDHAQYEVDVLAMLARAQIELGHFKEAGEALRKGEAIADTYAVETRGLLWQRSVLQLRLGHAEEAVATAREGIRRPATGPADSPDPLLLGTLARALAASGRAGEAIDELRKAVAVIEDRQREIGAHPLGRAAFLAEHADLYLDLVELLVERNDVDEAFRVAEQMRGRGLREAIADSQIDLSASLSADERLREKALEDRVVEINKTLLAARQKSEPSAALERELESARTELSAFESEIRIKHPAIGRRRMDDDAVLALPEPSKSLALIEYVVGKKQAIAFVVTSHSPIRAVRLPIARETIERDAHELEILLAARTPGYRVAARRMYEALLAPLNKYVHGMATLAIVPDGALWTVPFHALIAGDGRYLIDHHTVFYAHSLSLLRHASTLQTTAAPRLLALGNPTIGLAARSDASSAFRGISLGPLAAAESEVRSLASMYPRAERNVYFGDAASEARFKDEAPASSVIHIAAHALIDDRAPMYSAIVLSAKADADDGLLEAREVAGLSLNAGLAVLSACQTARGRVRSGEGVIGLNWSFFAAGCPTTVVSQWNAESEATAALMIELHRGLRAGQTTAEALRAAQKSVRTQEQYRHPFYWAPFIAVGAANRALRR